MYGHTYNIARVHSVTTGSRDRANVPLIIIIIIIIMDQPGKFANPARSMYSTTSSLEVKQYQYTSSSGSSVSKVKTKRDYKHDWQPMKNSETASLFSSRSQMSAELLNCRIN